MTHHCGHYSTAKVRLYRPKKKRRLMAEVGGKEVTVKLVRAAVYVTPECGYNVV